MSDAGDSMAVRHNKTGVRYKIVTGCIVTTTEREGQVDLLYLRADTWLGRFVASVCRFLLTHTVVIPFVRESEEFMEKFTPCK